MRKAVERKALGRCGMRTCTCTHACACDQWRRVQRVRAHAPGLWMRAMACTSTVGLYEGPSMTRWLAPTKLMPTARSTESKQTRGSLAPLLNLRHGCMGVGRRLVWAARALIASVGGGQGSSVPVDGCLA